MLERSSSSADGGVNLSQGLLYGREGTYGRPKSSAIFSSLGSSTAVDFHATRNKGNYDNERERSLRHRLDVGLLSPWSRNSPRDHGRSFTSPRGYTGVRGRGF
ncbi:unnamed protein product [Amoebophrya sp. A25]|nr:unnamed protein product [Amoebophrya sp. A25]|eukprot:GSA25T00016333001.1